MDTEESILMCMRVEAGLPRIPNCEMTACHNCQALVWRAPSSPAGVQPWCVECVCEQVGEGSVKVAPLTEEQLAEILTAMDNREVKYEH